MHGDEIEPGLELVELAREVGEIDRSGGAVIELARIGLGIGGELRHRLHRQMRADDEHLVGIHHLGDAGEVPGRIIAGALRDGGDIGERRGVAEQQRVAVGVGCCHRLGADGAAAAAAVVDDDRLPERRRHAVGDEPRQHVGRPAGAGRHDHLDDLGRIGLRVCAPPAWSAAHKPSKQTRVICGIPGTFRFRKPDIRAAFKRRHPRWPSRNFPGQSRAAGGASRRSRPRCISPGAGFTIPSRSSIDYGHASVRGGIRRQERSRERACVAIGLPRSRA